MKRKRATKDAKQSILKETFLSKIFKGLAVLMVALFLFILGYGIAVSHPTPAASDPEMIYNKYVQSVVLVEGTDGHAHCGGGQMLHNGKVVVVTAGHCIHEGQTLGYIRFHDNQELPFQVIKVDRDVDLAMLQPLGEVANPKPLMPSVRITYIGETVYLSGYTAGIPFSLTVSHIQMVGLPNHGGVPSDQISDGASFWGSSGSLVINADNQVIGVLQEIGPTVAFGIPFPTSAYFCNLETLQDFLAK